MMYIIFLFIFIYFIFNFNFVYIVIHLLASSSFARSLSKVMTHVALEVEIGELIRVLKLKELLKLAVGENATAIGGVLKLVLADVRVNLTSYISAGHLSPLRLVKELSKLLADTGGLNETTGGTVTGLALRLAGSLVSLLNLTIGTLLDGTNLRGYTCELTTESRKLTEESIELIRESGNRRSSLNSFGDYLISGRR